DLLSFRQCELFVNYMANPVKRFATAGNIDEQLEELFGTDEFRNVGSLYGDDRERFLHDLYERQLQEQCGFDYVQSFGMKNMAGHITYYLFYGTRNTKGLQLMKDAMWRLDPGGGYRFSDRLAGQDILFDESVMVTGPLREALLRHF